MDLGRADHHLSLQTHVSWSHPPLGAPSFSRCTVLETLCYLSLRSDLSLYLVSPMCVTSSHCLQEDDSVRGGDREAELSTLQWEKTSQLYQWGWGSLVPPKRGVFLRHGPSSSWWGSVGKGTGGGDSLWAAPYWPSHSEDVSRSNTRGQFMTRCFWWSKALWGSWGGCYQPSTVNVCTLPYHSLLVLWDSFFPLPTLLSLCIDCHSGCLCSGSFDQWVAMDIIRFHKEEGFPGSKEIPETLFTPCPPGYKWAVTLLHRHIYSPLHFPL